MSVPREQTPETMPATATPAEHVDRSKQSDEAGAKQHGQDRQDRDDSQSDEQTVVVRRRRRPSGGRK